MFFRLRQTSQFINLFWRCRNAGPVPGLLHVDAVSEPSIFRPLCIHPRILENEHVYSSIA
jgi:hypothetical protein